VLAATRELLHTQQPAARNDDRKAHTSRCRLGTTRFFHLSASEEQALLATGKVRDNQKPQPKGQEILGPECRWGMWTGKAFQINYMECAQDGLSGQGAGPSIEHARVYRRLIYRLTEIYGLAD
jgi:hypothetical protein